MSNIMSTMKDEIEALKQKALSKTITAAERLKLKRLRLDLEELRLNEKAAKNQSAKRKIETRQKIILGSWVLQISSDPRMQELMRDSLTKFLDERDKAFLADLMEANNV